MIITNKIKFINVKEYWFEENFNNCILSFKIIRDSRKNINNFFCKKQIKYTLITDLTLKEEEIFKQFKSNYRNEIRKVNKIENFKVELNSINIEEFVEFYNKFLAKPKNLSFMSERRLSKFKENIVFLVGKLDNQITNIQVYIKDEDKKIVRLLHSVNLIHLEKVAEKRKNIGFINKYLHWYAIKLFKNKQYNIFDWGGYGNDKSNRELVGIDKFKKGFGGEIIEIYDYYSFIIYLLLKVY